MEEWKEYIVSDLGRIVTGKTPRTSIPENYGGIIPFLTPSDDLSGKYSPKTIKTITDIGLNEVKNCLLPSRSICVSCIGSDLGKVVITKEPTVTNQQFNSIIPNDENDADYIYYLMTIVGKQLNYLSKTSTAVPIINKSTFSNFRVKLPSKIVQHRIASILSSLDDKIEVNRKINENLEQQAQALFKSWFVDFEPFKNGEFVESELGMIPKGWRVEFFKEVCNNITDGVHNSVKDDINGNYYLLSCKNIKGGVITIGENERKINKETFEKLRKRTRLQKGDLLLSSVGTIGEIVLLNEIPSNYEFQRSVAIIKPNKEIIFSHFLYYAMKAQKDEIIHSAHGAVQQCLFISDVANFKTIVPPREVMQHFTNIAVELHEKISKNNQESRRLAELRDTLLPKLMSGELKVNEIA